jgi:AAA15 family ATPase/GTPase
MDSHFLTDIDIIDFKCFQNFSAKGFKRVNLIGGKNNIGKTAFMEACYINVFAKDMKSMLFTFIDIKVIREKANLITKDLGVGKMGNYLRANKYYDVKSNVNCQTFKSIEKDVKKEYHFNINNVLTNIGADVNIYTIIQNTELYNHEDGEDKIANSNTCFIDSFGKGDDSLIKLYQTIQKQDKEHELNNLIKKFDSSITNFKVIGDKPQCKTNDKYRDLTEFGDGLKHYISIICALYACKNGYLFIDEIDNGIYYDQLDRLWEIILTISKETNCQVFATTHSKEMIESFARISQKLNEQDISYTTLVKNDKNEVKALVQSYGMFMYSMNFEHEVR